MQWGTRHKFGNLIINARFEEIKQKRMFKRPVEINRCAVYIDGYYEWKKVKGETRKVPYFISKKKK